MLNKLNKLKNIFWKSKGFTISLLAFLLPLLYIMQTYIYCIFNYCDSGLLGMSGEKLGAQIIGFFIWLALSILAMIVSHIEKRKNKQNKLAKIGFYISHICPIGILLIMILSKILRPGRGALIVSILLISTIITFFYKKRVKENRLVKIIYYLLLVALILSIVLPESSFHIR